MNLQDILIDAGAGFTAGLVVGLAGMPEKLEEKLELIELISEENIEKYEEKLRFVDLIPKEDREKKGLTKKELKDLKSKLKISKICFPVAVAGAYSILSSLISQNPELFSRSFYTAIPSAYFGRFVGSRIRKFKNKKRLEEQRNEIKAGKDFGNMHKYFLPKDKAEIIDNVFSEIEKKTLDGKQDEILHDLHGGPIRKIYDAITEKKTKYTPLLLAWSLVKQTEILKHANLQRDITRFYERGYKGMPPKPFSIADCAILGKPKNPKIKIFTKEGGDFYIQSVELPNLKIIKDDKTGIVEVVGDKRPKTIATEREIWTDDYKALTDRFLYEEKAGNGYTMMLMNIPSGMPNEMKADLVMISFLPLYEKYHSKGENKK